jgi:hypothetical protein
MHVQSIATVDAIPSKPGPDSETVDGHAGTLVVFLCVFAFTLFAGEYGHGCVARIKFHFNLVNMKGKVQEGMKREGKERREGRNEKRRKGKKR